MKTMPLIAALILAGASSGRGQGADGEADAARELIRLEREWGDAIVKRDVAAMDRILAEDYVMTSPEGLVVTRGKILEFFRSPRDAPPAITGADNDDISARIYGETAVVSYRFTLKLRSEGRDTESPFRHTDVFVKKDGRWRCVSRQATRIAGEYGHARGDKPRRDVTDGG